MNKFDELIQAIRDKAKANPGDPLRVEKSQKDQKDQLEDRPAERRFRLPYSSNPRPMGERWKKSA